MATDGLGIYVHVPFCKSKCSYCDFFSFAGCNEETVIRYTDAVVEEIKSSATKNASVDSVFFGGGTPSLLPLSSFERISRAIYERFCVSEEAEFTVESNPGTLAFDSLKIYKSLGANRISLGLQSSCDNELKKLGRIHSFDKFIESYELCRDAGFDNINVDLMYGIPDQTLESFSKTLETVTALSPEHISVYGLMLEEGTPLCKNQDAYHFPTEDDEADMYFIAADILSRHGYKHYEISNYSKPGYECRHNLRYWRAKEYLGFGPSAHSYYKGRRFYNSADFDEYFLPERRQYVSEEIDIRSEAFEYAMLRLRLADGFSLDEYESRFGDRFLRGKEDIAGDYERMGLIYLKDGRISLSEKGFYLSNSIISSLL